MPDLLAALLVSALLLVLWQALNMRCVTLLYIYFFENHMKASESPLESCIVSGEFMLCWENVILGQ